MRVGTLRAIWASLLILAAASSIGPSPAAAAPGEVIVADNGGSLLAVNAASGAQRTISTDARSAASGGAQLFSDIFGVAREADGNLIVIARRGAPRPPNSDPSRLIRVNAATGAQSLLASDPQMTYGLTAVAVAPNGDIYFGDEGVPDPSFNGGAVMRADRLTGALSVVTTNAKSNAAGGAHRVEAPLGLSVSPDGQLWVLADSGGDDSAPSSPNDFVGAILRVDVATGAQTVFTSNYISTTRGGRALFADPRAFVRAPNGDFYVVDDAAINDPKFTANDTKVVKVDGATGAQSLVTDNATSQANGGGRLFNRPYGIAIDGDGELLVGDGNRVLRINPANGAQSVLSSGGQLANAVGLVGDPNPSPVPIFLPTRARCAGKKGAGLARCQARERHSKALAACSKAKGKQKAKCVKKANRAYKRQLALIKCRSIKQPKGRAACIRRVKQTK